MAELIKQINRIEPFKKKIKNKNNDVIILSLINHCFLDLYQEVDLYRLDLIEIAAVLGFNNVKKVMVDDLLPFVKNFKKTQPLLAIDVPICGMYSTFDVSLEKVLDFFARTAADLLIFDINPDISPLLKKLSQLSIPFAVHHSNQDKELDFQKVIHELKIFEVHQPLFAILENYPEKYLIEIQKNISVPIISDSKARTAGFYARLSSQFGFISELDQKKYLNIAELLKDSIKDCVQDHQ